MLTRSVRFTLLSAGVAIALPAFGLATASIEGCGSSEERGSSSDAIEDASAPDVDAGGEATTLHPDAAPLPGEDDCTVATVTGMDVPSAKHLDVCTAIDYATNPPNGGDHWPRWAAYKSYAEPVPREMYVHNLEHGGVVLAYRCTDDCPQVIAMLKSVAEKTKADPLCVTGGQGVSSRLVITPDPKLDVPIAASAWGATYRATCIDEASLAAFVAEVYGKGTEATCANGVAIDSPDAGALNCDGGDGG